MDRLIAGEHNPKVLAQLAETGVDMSRFRAGAHLSSWVGRLPGQPAASGTASPAVTCSARRSASLAMRRSSGVRCQRLIRRVPPARGQV